MTDPPVPKHYSPMWSGDTRTTPPALGDERETLSSYLDWHRATFELKCSGVPLERLLAGVERWWFRIQFAGEDVPMLYYSDDDPDQDFDSLEGDIEESFDVWRAECQRSREIVAAAASLDETGTRRSTGEPFSLRWLMVRLIAEYARHDGHADLLRERIDGATGM